MTDPSPSTAPLGGADHRLLRGYAPAALLTVVFLVMVLLAPTVAPEQTITNQGFAASGSGSEGQPDRGDGPESADGSAAPGASEGAAPGADPSTAADAEPGAGSPAEAPGVEACEGFQVPDDPYSPPCAAWAGGDNGGATSRGVSDEAITVVLRDAGVPDPGSLIAQFSGVSDYVSNHAELERTIRVLIEYFNTNYEFYGRRIELKTFTGQGNLIDEALGGGQSGAQADAITVAEEIQAFASLAGLSQQYSDALASRQVMVFDNLFMNNDWATDRAPYAWNTYSDCSKSARIGAEMVVKQLVGGTAEHAGDDYVDSPRKFGIIAPDSVYGKPCIDIVTKALSEAGSSARVVTYTPDIGTIQNQGQQIASTMKADGITTVLLLSDPATPFFFSSGAQSIRWFPEWVMFGQPYLDFDYLAQIFPSQQWQHTFGFSFAGQQLPVRATDAYRAYKSVSPDTEPAVLLLPAMYAELRMLAIGLQQAGPALTPESFAAGLRSYANTAGPDGTIAFPEGDFSGPQDIRFVWWDPDAVSPTNDRPGAYLDNGQRYQPGSLPAGPAPVFGNA